MADGSASRIGIDTTKAPEPPISDRPVDPSRYWDRDFWRAEWDKIWTKTWQIAGLTAQLEKKGDFITMDFGEEVILCVRGDDDKIRAFYNVCQHRGMLMKAEEQGNADRLVCPYHGWIYDLQGVLKSVPDLPDFTRGNPCGKKNLIEIPCDTWAGFVWFNMDPHCETLRTALAPHADQIDAYPMEEMVRTHWITIEGDFNWKLVQDNFSESYHVNFVHPHGKFAYEPSYRYSQFDLYETGHCRMLMPGSQPSMLVRGSDDQVLAAMGETLIFWELNPDDFRGRTHEMRAAVAAQKRKLGASKGFDFSRYDDNMLTDHWHYTFFPNLSFSLKSDGNIWLRVRPHPKDPEKCFFDMWFMTLFPKGVDRVYSPGVWGWTDRTKPAEHKMGKVGELSMGPTIDGDVSIWTGLQKALHSRGYQEDFLAWQERRVRYFHDTIDLYLAK